MIAPNVSGAGGATVDPRDAALKKSAHDLQGVFVQQLYKAMRETVPTDGGLVERSQGEDIFAGLMDEGLAADTGTRWHRGLGDAIYRALQRKAGIDAASANVSSIVSPIAAPLVQPQPASAQPAPALPAPARPASARPAVPSVLLP
jgi:peptidoglycan hydrolase FlgJ